MRLRSPLTLLALAALVWIIGPRPTAAIAAGVIVSGQVTVEGSDEPVTGVSIRLLAPESMRPVVPSKPAAAVKGAHRAIRQTATAVPTIRVPATAVRPTRPGAPGAATAAEPLVVVQTLKNGSFILRAPHPGRYRLAIDDESYFPYEKAISVPATGTTGLKIALLRPPTLDVSLLGPDGKPVADGVAEVWLLVQHLTQPRQAAASWNVRTAVAGGHFRVSTSRAIHDKEAGAFGLTVRVPGVGIGQTAGSAWPDGSITLSLKPGISVTGRAMGGDGKPQAGANLLLEGAAHNPADRFLQGWIDTTAGPDGAFTVSNVLPGRHDLREELPDQKHYHILDAAEGSAPVTLLASDRQGPSLDFFPWNGPQPDGSANLTLLYPMNSPDASKSIAVSGHVMDHGAGGKPVAGVPVALYSTDSEQGGGTPPLDVGVSAADGSVSVLAPTPGQYRLTIGSGWNSDYPETSRIVTIPAAGLKDQVWVAARRPSIRVHVQDADGKPVANKPVEISAMIRTGPNGYGAGSDSNTDANGNATVQLYNEIDPTNTTSIDLTLHANDIGGARVHLDTWPTELVTAKLTGGREIVGRVLGPKGAPDSGASLTAQLMVDQTDYPAFQSMGSATAGADGKFKLTGLMPGYYVVTVTSTKGVAPSTIVDARAATPRPLSVRLGPSLSISGKLLDANGTGISGVQVRAFRLPKTSYWPNFEPLNTNPMTDAAGGFRFDGLRPGFYVISGQSPNNQSTSADVLLKAGKSEFVVLRMGGGATLPVRVLDATGKPLSGIHVTSYQMDLQNQSPNWNGGSNIASDIDGRCSFTNLAPGEYLLLATLPGAGRVQKLVKVGLQNGEITIGPGDHI